MGKKVMLYGSADCPGCVATKETFEKEGIRYGYVDVLAGVAHLKKFLNLRDANPAIYKEVVEKGSIGIPTIVVNDKDIYVGIDGVDINTFRQEDE